MDTLQETNISPQNGTFEDDFPFPQAGYVNSLEGMLWNIILGDTFGSKALMRFPKFFIAIDNYTLEFPDGEDWSFESDSCSVSPCQPTSTWLIIEIQTLSQKADIMEDRPLPREVTWQWNILRV